MYILCLQMPELGIHYVAIQSLCVSKFLRNSGISWSTSTNKIYPIRRSNSILSINKIISAVICPIAGILSYFTIAKGFLRLVALDYIS